VNGLPLSLGAVATLAVAVRAARRGSLSLLDYASMSDDELVENEDRQRTSLKRRRDQRAKMRPAVFRPAEMATADRQVAWREEELAALEAQRVRRGSRAAAPRANPFQGVSLAPFTPVGLERGPRENEVFAWIHPSDFCRLASTNCDMLDDRRVADYARDMRKGSAFPVPTFMVDCDGDEPLCAIASHEGRHRAMAALRAGHDRIPVVFTAIWPSSTRAKGKWSDFVRSEAKGHASLWSQYFDEEEIDESNERLLEQDIVGVSFKSPPSPRPARSR